MSVNCQSYFTLKAYTKTSQTPLSEKFRMDCEEASEFFKKLENDPESYFKVSNQEIFYKSGKIKKNIRVSESIELIHAAKKLDSIISINNRNYLNTYFKPMRTCTY